MKAWLSGNSGQTSEDVTFQVGDGSRIMFVGRVFAGDHAPVLSRGTHTAIDDVDPAHTFVVAPVAESYRIKPGITVVSLSGLFAEIGNIL